MKILFMGTPEFAVPSLRSILEQNHTVVGVVSQPDKPKGRGKQIAPTPVKEFALEKGLPIYQPISIRKEPEFVEIVRQLSPELIVVVAYGQILPPALLDIPKYGCVNVHSSLLPKYRGAAPAAWAIINGEKVTGVSIMFLNPKMDEGDVIYQEKVPIYPNDTRGILENRLSQVGAELLKRTINDIQEGIAPRIPQNHSLASYAPRLTKEHELLDWSKPAVGIANLIRGLQPEPGAYTLYNGKRIRIIDSAYKDAPEIIAPPGTILSIVKGSDGGILVATGNNILIMKQVQPEGKKIMSAIDFANGYRLEPNQRFTSEPAL